MNKQIISLTQQIQSLHLKSPLKKNVIRLLVFVPFSLGSICKFYVIITKGYSHPSQISKMELFEKIANGWNLQNNYNYNYFNYNYYNYNYNHWQEGSEYASGWHIETWQIEQICVIRKTKCFYSFINNSKSKQN